jgi:hypothetical protein
MVKLLNKLRKWYSNRVERLCCWIYGHDEAIIEKYETSYITKNFITAKGKILQFLPFTETHVRGKFTCRHCRRAHVNR